MNPLQDYPKARKIAYQLFWAVSLVVGAIQLGVATTDTPTPSWLTVTLAVLPFLGAGIGYTAAANVTTAPPLQPLDRDTLRELLRETMNEYPPPTWTPPVPPAGPAWRPRSHRED